MPLRSQLLLRQLRRLPARPAPDPSSDAALLACFVHDRDETAFSVLVERHFGLVRGVCHRVLHDIHAAEDVAQATFLLLARKAASLRRPEGLSAWLYGAARRLALRYRRAEVRRRQREARACAIAARLPDDPLNELTARELLLLIDEEIQRLPEVYRLPILLCCLEGHDQAEVARRLGWTPGSLKGRLERGRSRLHARLARRGLTLPAALLALGVAHAGAPTGLAKAAVAFAARAPVAEGVSGAVIALAQGGLRTMLFSRLQVMLVVATLGLAASGAGWLAAGTGRGGPAATAAAPVTRPQPPAAPKEKKEDKRARALEQAQLELRRATEQAEDLDNKLTSKVIEARQRLVELEEQLRQTEMEPPLEIRGQQASLRKEAERLIAALNQIERTSAHGRNDPTFRKTQSQLEQVQKRLTDLDNAAVKVRAMQGKQRLDLRRQMVQQEEELRQLERKRDAVRDQAERGRQEAAERLRWLAGGPARGQPEPPLRDLTRKLDAIQRELTELRREVQRLRPARPQ